MVEMDSLRDSSVGFFASMARWLVAFGGGIFSPRKKKL